MAVNDLLHLLSRLEDVVSEIRMHPAVPLPAKTACGTALDVFSFEIAQGTCPHDRTREMDDWCAAGSVEYLVCLDCGKALNHKIIR